MTKFPTFELDNAPNVVNGAQIAALAMLLDIGGMRGAQTAKVKPPERVAIACIGQLVDGVRTLGVMDDDGRAWQIPPVGHCWQVES